ncbi:MAG TPA: hypothetical protein VKI41_13985 [Vicinamibacteria bacterium]|nr:hypothetical protein [Vicinamibacteria bacterium]
MRWKLALLLLGAWVGVLAGSWVMATFNLRAADRVLGPGGRFELAEKLAGVAAPDRRAALRHLGAELSRWMFSSWAVVQLGLGAALLALLWPGGGLSRLLPGLALVVVLAQAAALGPLARRGRALDFVPRPLRPEDARPFGLLHAAFLGADVLKASALVGTAFLLLRRP